MNRMDWPALMRAGLRGLHLSPASFWALTPAELALLLGKGGAQAPMGRGGLDRLMQIYPDPASGSLKGQQDD
ncbi:MAG: rcc01693 family protein [Paracoccaceae bacterium]